MKALRLEIEGFGPYLARQTVDFREFDAEGLFVISGKTGAGKSTILDAITFALYGDVPRYAGTEKTIRSHFCGEDDATEVVLDFEVGEQTYRIRRSPDYERVKQRGEGTTVQPAEAQLWVRRGGDWEALAMKPREAGQEIARIMQLTAEQFLQVILLAQGRFAEFLQAGTESRLRLLRSLFGTQRFEDVTAHLRDLARQRARALEADDAELGMIVASAVAVAAQAWAESDQAAAPEAADRDAWFTETGEVLATHAVALEAAAREAAAAAEAARDTLGEARTVEAQRERLRSAREKVEALEGRAEEHAADRDRLDRARRAAPVASAMETAESAQARLALTEERRGSAVATVRSSEVATLAWPDGDPADADLTALRNRVAELATERGALTAALDAEQRLGSL